MTLSPPVATEETTRSTEATGRRVASVLLLAIIAGGVSGGFLGVAPNRILSATRIYLWQVEPRWIPLVVIAGAIVAALGLLLAAPARHAVGVAGWTVTLITTIAGAGVAASARIDALGSTTARVSLGAAFWVIVVGAALAISDDLLRLRAPLAMRVGFAAAIIAVLVFLAANGCFDNLSLAREWVSRRDTYGLAFAQHMTLVGSALIFALLIGVPLGIVAARRRRLSGRIFDVLNILQTIPSIALFGLLIGPLTGLAAAFPLLRAAGLDGIGFAPAVLALVLYALLPVARNTEAAVRSVPADLIETARGMGMTPTQILLHVTLPVASPILLAGLRIVVVQLIGLAVVAALIGAGGFGTFVFLGLGQTATDLVLLGALSAIAIAVVADALLRLLSAAALARVRP